MDKIELYTIYNESFWAKENTDSALMLRHINNGELAVHGKDALHNITKLAESHGWTVATIATGRP
jgi:hypothetical protein